MRSVIQRVTSSRVLIDGQIVGEIKQGLLVLAAAHRNDTHTDARKAADRVAGLRIFNDADGKINLALKDLPESANAGVLAISNFTVYGETSKNRRPSFIESAPFDRGKELFDIFVEELRNLGCRVECGVFGADMQVELVNDGPVTVIVDVSPSGENLQSGS